MKELRKFKNSKKVNCIVLTRWDDNKPYMLRHILYDVDENIEKIKKNYYKDFAKFEDDEFFIFKNNKDANEILKGHGIKPVFFE